VIGPAAEWGLTPFGFGNYKHVTLSGLVAASGHDYAVEQGEDRLRFGSGKKKWRQTTGRPGVMVRSCFSYYFRLSYWGRSLEAVAVCVSSGRPGAASVVFSHSMEIAEAFWPALVCVAHPAKQG
jgi:hypothetical protein